MSVQLRTSPRPPSTPQLPLSTMLLEPQRAQPCRSHSNRLRVPVRRAVEVHPLRSSSSGDGTLRRRLPIAVVHPVAAA
jgi:hypothetical protein